MQMRIIEKDKSTIKIQMVDADITLIHPLVEELMNDPKVEKALYHEGHPQLDLPVLEVRVKSGKPDAIVRKACRTLSQQYKDMRDIIGSKMDKL